MLLMGLEACDTVIGLRDTGLPVAELGVIYLRLLHGHPELFYVAPRLSYGYTESSVNGVPCRTVTEVYPVYTMTGEELTAARTLFKEGISSVLTEMEEAFGGGTRSEAETVLYLHDWLAEQVSYDTRPEQEANADAYSLLRDGRGICQAYSLAFLALARGAGLEADLVVSDGMDHAWNHVRVDGVWYHVDVTRDDPIPPEGGSPAVTHTRLLRSDGGMSALGYVGYACASGHTCTDTRYETSEGGLLDGFSTPLTHVGTGWVGMDGEGGMVGVKFTETSVIVGQVGDVNVDGSIDPVDLLAVYDPALPEDWREWMRGRLVK